MDHSRQSSIEDCITYDPYNVGPDSPYTPEYRRWGGAILTAQNQRLVYWPMLRTGDFEIIGAQFDFYLRLLIIANRRSYFGVNGAYFNEQISYHGLENPSDWMSTAEICNKYPPSD